jgi:hypothetical protein
MKRPTVGRTFIQGETNMASIVGIEDLKAVHQAAADAVEVAVRAFLAAEYAFKVADYERLLDSNQATETAYDTALTALDLADRTKASAFESLQVAARALGQAYRS